LALAAVVAPPTSGDLVGETATELDLGFFEFVHDVRRRGKALLGALIELLVAPTPRNAG